MALRRSSHSELCYQASSLGAAKDGQPIAGSDVYLAPVWLFPVFRVVVLAARVSWKQNENNLLRKLKKLRSVKHLLHFLFYIFNASFQKCYIWMCNRKWSFPYLLCFLEICKCFRGFTHLIIHHTNIVVYSSQVWMIGWKSYFMNFKGSFEW